MSAPQTFDDVIAAQSPGGQSRGCPRCGAPRNVGVVTVMLRSLGPTGSAKGSKTLCSKGVSLCEPCSVEVYLPLEALLLKERA